MLEIRNVTKVYRPKKGVPVTALDGVSLRFPERGMVFLLGKSGSGKSTLLNVLGGLDKCDSGEIVIKGKSSKDFSQSDFDSYRNTYLGFIFQEYNILNEFTVGANIGLALQLQGKKAGDEAINAILEEVDLIGYGNRKPNELSGGQKQRVAIARALVKNPEIILADEPTGALDSNTGIQVFDTLKKLSRDKLVIVVTHDREFAEYYGDRVIELKDGKVISDIEKYKAQGARLNPALTVIDNKIIQIKKGYKLTKEDLDMINEYVADHDAIISVDNKANADLKKYARIDDEGNREAFKETDESTINIPEEKSFKLIKSRLPFRNSFKIGASSLKNKPFRLAFTIFLSMVAFAMFGLADTMAAYNKYTTTRSSIEDSNINALSYTKNMTFHNEQYDYDTTAEVRANDEDIATLKSKTGVDFKPVFLAGDDYSLSFSGMFKEGANKYLYVNQLSGFYETDAEELAKLGYTYKGTLPQAYDEIAVSEYVYRHFKEFGYKYNAKEKSGNDLPTPEAFLAIAPVLRLGNNDYKVTAVIDTQFDYDHFAGLDDPDANALMNYMLKWELDDTVGYGYHGLAFVKPGFIESKLNGKAFVGTKLSNSYMSLSNQDISHYMSGNRLYKIDQLADLDAKYDYFDDKTTVGENEILIEADEYASLLMNAITYGLDGNSPSPEDLKQNAPAWLYKYLYGYPTDPDTYVSLYLYENYSPDFDEFFNDNNIDISDYTIDNKVSELIYYMQMNQDDKTYTPKSYTELAQYYEDNYRDMTLQEFQASVIVEAIDSGDIVDDENPPPAYRAYLSNYLTGYYQEDVVFRIAGVYYAPDVAFDGYIDFVVSDNLYNRMDSGDDGIYRFLIAPMPSGEILTDIIKFSYDYKNENVSFTMRNGVMVTLDMVNDLIETLADVFLYVGIGAAVFSALMLANFIGTSIAYKRREIGILRAVGARSSDVFGIFFNESLLIAAINFVLATIASGVVVLILNRVIRNDYNIFITILNFGIRQVALMLGISVAVAFIASFIPVYKVARQRPVDAIKK